MSRTMGVFIGSREPLRSLAADVGSALGISWEQFGTSAKPRKEWYGLGVDLILYEQGYTGDPDAAPDKYRFCLCVYQRAASESATALADAAARFIYETLRAQRRWPLLLTEDGLQKAVAAYDPGA